MSHTFTIPGKPAGWRIQYRAYVIGKKKARVDTRLADNAEAWQKPAIVRLRMAWGSRAPLTGPLKVEVYAVFPRAKHHDCQHTPRGWDPSRTKPCSCPPEKLDGRALWHTSTSDYTNVKKLAEDALTKAGVIEDDRLTCVPGGLARYAARGEEPHVRIVVGPAPELETMI